MKLMRSLIMLAVAVLAVAAVAYAVIRHFDEVMRPIHALLKKFGIEAPHSCDCCCCDEEIFEVNAEE